MLDADFLQRINEMKTNTKRMKCFRILNRKPRVLIFKKEYYIIRGHSQTHVPPLLCQRLSLFPVIQNVHLELVHFYFWDCLLISPIFVAQKAVALRNWVEFHQKSIGAIRWSLATAFDNKDTHEQKKPHVGAAPNHKDLDLVYKSNF